MHSGRPFLLLFFERRRVMEIVERHFTMHNNGLPRTMHAFHDFYSINIMPELSSHLLPPADRTVFFVSDGTGITAETFGHAVLTQFELRFKQIRLPFIDTLDKAYEAVREINEAFEMDGKRPIVFSTLVKAELSSVVRQSKGMHMDLIQTFVDPLEQELGVKSTHTVGRSHNIADSDDYKNRIEAINFSLAHDDGQSDQNLAAADVILVGVSRSGKTPTSLYLAMQYGVKAANYPLIPDDFERDKLPTGLLAYKRKIFGLSIAADRLSEVRNERRPGSKYASLENCRYEINEAEKMMRREGIRWMSSTAKSIEEIATMILQEIKSDRRAY
jgi:[pyruvate, water dikinase]-phosphate phosphotransferase / [pyruvate, water dikinase] kinase